MTGTFADLEALDVGPTDWLRVVVRAEAEGAVWPTTSATWSRVPSRSRSIQTFSRPLAATSATRTAGRSPVELFGDYLASQNRGDAETLTKRFAEILDDVQGANA